jgi:hypothetical protein
MFTKTFWPGPIDTGNLPLYGSYVINIIPISISPGSSTIFAASRSARVPVRCGLRTGLVVFGRDANGQNLCRRIVYVCVCVCVYIIHIHYTRFACVRAEAVFAGSRSVDFFLLFHSHYYYYYYYYLPPRRR